MKIIQSCIQGARHAAEGRPCQDRTGILNQNGVFAIALADGAGNKKYTHSAQGAECVVKTITKFFCDNFDRFYEKSDTEELQMVVKTVCQRALRKEADKVAVEDIGRFSSTLLAVAVKGNRVILCHIGDGVIGKISPRGARVLSEPENGEFAGQTFFITNPEAERKIRIQKGNVKDTLAYFLMSDGTAEYVYDSESGTFLDAARKLGLLAYDARGQEKLEESMRTFMVDADAASDDCSFICMLLADEVEPPKGKNDKAFSEDGDEETKKAKAEPQVPSDRMESTGRTKERKVWKVAVIAFVFAIVVCAGVYIGMRQKKTRQKCLEETTTEETTTEETTTEGTTAEETATESGTGGDDGRENRGHFAG